MQRKTSQRRIYDLLDQSKNHKINVVKISRSNSIQHETAKFLVCLEYHKLGVDFITEAIFKTGQRADILLLNGVGDVIEILHSEKERNTRKKAYPLPTTKLNATEIIKTWQKKLDSKPQ